MSPSTDRPHLASGPIADDRRRDIVPDPLPDSSAIADDLSGHRGSSRADR